MAIDEKKLKPCPFCGYHAVLESGKARKGYDAIIKCNCCGAEYQSVYFDTLEDAENDAINSWNRRTSDKWIPCSERLPPKLEDGIYKGYIVQVINVLEPFSAYWDGENWLDEWYEKIYDVIAWSELPEPYKEKKNEK